MKNFTDYLFRFIYPARCIFCDTLLNLFTDIEVCDDCNEKIDYYQSDWINSNELELTYCNKGLCVSSYSGIVKDKLIYYKFNKKPYLFRGFAQLLIKKIKSVNLDELYDIIISVPISKSRLSIRGYNQSYLMSKYIAKILGKPDKSHLLIKNVDTKVQSLLRKDERYHNVKGVFKITDNQEIIGKKILIIDDILTTGNTVEECSKVLLENGAIKVYVACIASGKVNNI